MQGMATKWAWLIIKATKLAQIWPRIEKPKHVKLVRWFPLGDGTMTRKQLAKRTKIAKTAGQDRQHFLNHDE